MYADIWRGSFPALVAGPVHDWHLFYSSYLQTYLQRDVQDLAQVGNEAAFLRFLRAAAARTAQLLNLSDLARDADIAVNTAKHWLSILQASFQVVLLPAYATTLSTRLVKRPKLYFLVPVGLLWRDGRQDRPVGVLLTADSCLPSRQPRTRRTSPRSTTCFRSHRPNNHATIRT